MSLKKTALKLFVPLLVGWGAIEYFQNQRNEERDDLDHVVEKNSFTTKNKILQLIVTTQYDGEFDEKVSKITESKFMQNNSNAGTIHLYSPSLLSLEEARENIQEIKNNSQIKPIISVDLEGGSVHHLKLSLEDLKQFGVPQEIIEMRKRELSNFNLKNNENKKITDNGRSPTPSQEWIGREYEKVKNDSQEKRNFLKIISKYGETMAKICEYVGINIVFAPNLDRVNNIDGDSPLEYTDRSYGENYKEISELALAYISGFDKYDRVSVCPKHFVGNGLTSIDPHEKTAKINKNPFTETALLPFRDILKKGRYSERISHAKLQINNLKEANERHEKDIKNKINIQKTSLSIAANNKIIRKKKDLIKTLKENQLKYGVGKSIDFIMTSNVANNFYGEENTPTMFSRKALGALKRSKDNDGLGFQGLAITDDVRMKSSMNYIENLPYFKSELGAEVLAVWEALKSGNDLIMLKNSAGSRAENIAKKISELIEANADLDLDGVPDFTMKKLNRSFQKLMDVKLDLGLVDEMIFEEKEYYILNSKFHDITNIDVLWDSFFSNQWPWLSKSRYYKSEGREKDFKENLNLFFKAGKNFSLSLYRTLSEDINPKFEEAEKKSDKFIIIDKSVRHAFIYDKKSQKLEKKFEIAIGKGTNNIDGYGPRRIIGDYKTPVGAYKIVQKRDNIWWKDNKNTELPSVYGGKEGVVIAMTGQWHPEIALHTTNGETEGLQSNACIRLSKDEAKYLVQDIPIGTFVLITN